LHRAAKRTIIIMIIKLPPRAANKDLLIARFVVGTMITL